MSLDGIFDPLARAYFDNGGGSGGSGGGGSGGNQSGEMTADGADVYVIMDGMKMSYTEMMSMVEYGDIKHTPLIECNFRILVRDEPPFIGLTGYGLNELSNYFLVTNNGEIYMYDTGGWLRAHELGVPEHGWIEKEKLESLDPYDEANIGFYAVRTVRYPMLDGTLTDFTSNLEVIANRFADYYLLNTVNIPNAKIIGNNAFKNCYSLLSVNMPKVEAIGADAFGYCSKLNSIVLPNSLVAISSHAFRDCEKLESITFNGTVAQWNTITIDDGWNHYVPATEVVCNDGTVSLV